MGGSQDKVEAPISHAKIQTILNELQECLETHENHLNGKGFIMGELDYASFGDLKDEVLKEIPQGAQMGITGQLNYFHRGNGNLPLH